MLDSVRKLGLAVKILLARGALWVGLVQAATFIACGSATTSDAALDASSGSSVACRDDGGTGLASAARHCAVDGDCQIVVGQNCCGADSAFGVAKAQAQAYASCVGLPPNACQGLGCAKFIGYRADTGEMTVWDGPMANPMSQLAVSCRNELCTTSVIPLDAGSD